MKTTPLKRDYEWTCPGCGLIRISEPWKQRIDGRSRDEALTWRLDQSEAAYVPMSSYMPDWVRCRECDELVASHTLFASPTMKITELRMAFTWTCEECGRDHYEKPVAASQELMDEALATWPEGSVEPGFDWRMAPPEVTCPFCKITFETVEP